LDLIELLPPGLYEARIQDLHPDTPHQEWVKGRHVVTFEPRRIADLQALDDGREEEAHFEVVNRVSQINQHLYDLTLSPIVRSLHPTRFGRYMWSSLNPVGLSFKAAAEQVRKQRTPVAADNVFLAMERVMSDGIARSWDVWRDIRDRSVEAIFHGVYGSPWLR